jgi:hypothetical protein
MVVGRGGAIGRAVICQLYELGGDPLHLALLPLMAGAVWKAAPAVVALLGHLDLEVVALLLVQAPALGSTHLDPSLP